MSVYAERWFWLSTPRATGAIVTTKDGVVCGGCPYFRKAYRGQRLNDVIRRERGKGKGWVRWVPLLPDG